MRRLHVSHQGAHLAISILQTDEAQDFITTHASILDSSFEHTAMSDAMRASLRESDYIFSGIKTFHELNEAFPSLLDENGNRKPFEQFLNDVRSIDATYNGNYLRAEYNFCQQSANMASKWEQFMEDGDHYNLQYRTAGDDHVRPAHAALDRITLPPSHPFWLRYFPPNGWNCRCTVVQVRKSKYPVTPDSEVEHLIEQNDTQNQKEAMFRFNPGMEQKSFPDYNAYTIRRCQDCDIAKGKVNLAFVPENELCQACRLLHSLKKEEKKRPLTWQEKVQARESAEMWAEKHLPTVQAPGRPAKWLIFEGGQILRKKFFGEVYHHNMRNPLLAETMELATLIQEWFPKAEPIPGKEVGIDNPESFKAYKADYGGRQILCKTKIIEGKEFIYHMRIIK